MDGDIISGIFGTMLRTQDPVLGTSYIRPYVNQRQTIFIPYVNVINSAISMKWNDKDDIMPLSNGWETD